MTRNSRGPLTGSSLSPSFPSAEKIDGTAASEASAPPGANSKWKSNFSLIPVLSMTGRPDAPRVWEIRVMLAPSKSIIYWYDSTEPLGTPHGGFWPGSSGGGGDCEGSIGVQPPSSASWSLEQPNSKNGLPSPNAS